MKTRLFLSLFPLLFPVILIAQVIQIKTVPIATGDQFLIFPSRSLSMGGLSIAVDDELADPFVNPAKGVRVEGMKIVSAPVYYGISVNRGTSYEGSGLSFPLGMLFKSESFFGSLYLARQSLGSDYKSGLGSVRPAVFTTSFIQEPTTTNNTYSYAMAGTTISGTGVAVAASGFWADLNALEGVQLLYPNSLKLKQDGSAVEYRVSLLTEIKEGEFVDFTLLRSEFNMQYDVTTTAFNDPFPGPSTTTRTDQDQTNLWGARVGYVRPLEGTWRIGAQVTANWKSHPKIPNYDLMNIPRDPGNSTAYNLGIGLSSQKGISLFGVDLIYEPIRTETWADAERPITRWNNTVLPADTKTVENFFDFSNWILRTGFRASNGKTEFQGGINMHAISYKLHQIDNVRLTKRDQKESWHEWTFSFGLGFSFSTFQIRYSGLMTTGTGQPGVVSGWSTRTTAMGASDFLPAPGGQLNLIDAWVFTHQFSFVVPIR